MRRSGSGAGRGLTVASALIVMSLASVEPVVAQVGGDGFLFRQPRVTLGFKAGYALANAGSDIFDFTRTELTVGRDDFNSSTLGGDLSVRLTERVDLTMALGYSKAEVQSEFREWVDQDDQPIRQITRFRRVPVTLGLKAYLRERGRSIGRFAWVPTEWNAYAGAAGGFVWYEFEQVGDFVDFETYDIFADRFHSEGRPPTVHLFGGVEYTLSPMFLLTAEGRYGFASDEMDFDFSGFDPMDLAGFQATVGLSMRF